MRTRTVLTADDMKIILPACHAEAKKNGWNVSIAVVDEGGYLLHLERMDGAPQQSAEIATAKAYTSAVARATTKSLEDVVKERPAVAMMPRRLAIQGGVPLMKDGECIGAIGVSGVKSPEDEIVALAGQKALLGA